MSEREREGEKEGEREREREHHTHLELGVGEQDALGGSILQGLAVVGEGLLLHDLAVGGAKDLAGAGRGDVLIVTNL